MLSQISSTGGLPTSSRPGSNERRAAGSRGQEESWSTTLPTCSSRSSTRCRREEALVYLDHPGTGAERRLTYAQLDAAANRLAHHLRDSGIAAGEHVGLHLCNGVEYLQTALACVKIRAVPVNVNYRYVEDELVYLYRDADLAALVYDAEFGERVSRRAAAQPTGLRHLVRGQAPGTGPRTSVAFTDAERRPGKHRDSTTSRRGPPTTASSSTPAAPPVCPKGVGNIIGSRRTSSSPGWAAALRPAGPVGQPEELAERVAAGGEGLVFFPASAADARHLHPLRPSSRSTSARRWCCTESSAASGCPRGRSRRRRSPPSRWSATRSRGGGPRGQHGGGQRGDQRMTRGQMRSHGRGFLSRRTGGPRRHPGGPGGGAGRVLER
ncbi:Crotonobetaine/carnitine--CoA ligase [Streptomyces antimycoticus]